MYTCVNTYPDEPISAPGRIVIVPDIHADLEKAKQSLVLARVIDDDENWIADPPDTVVVQLGDQMDGKSRIPSRYPEGRNPSHVCGSALRRDIDVLTLFNRVHLKALERGGAVYSLLGNHEVMNARGMYTYVDDDGCQQCGKQRYACFSPGGAGARLLACTRAVVLQIDTFVFVHAGLLMKHLDAVHGDVFTLNRLVSRYLMGDALHLEERVLLERVILDPDGPLTTRQYSPGRANKDEALMVTKRLDIHGMFIGHNVHEDGFTSMFGGRVNVFDPGVSRAVSGAPASVLELIYTGTRWDLRRLG